MVIGLCGSLTEISTQVAVMNRAKNELQCLVASRASFLEFVVAHPKMKKPSISSILKWKTWLDATWLLTEH